MLNYQSKRVRYRITFISLLLFSLGVVACNQQRSAPSFDPVPDEELFDPKLIDTQHSTLDVVTVSASTHDGNIPENTLDLNLGTRWSALGDGQWIAYDLGSSHTVGAVNIAFYRGDKRITYFAIETSQDGSSWVQVFTGQSSGASKALETFTFPGISARYVRIIGHKNSENDWNSLTEVELHEGYEPSETGLPPGFIQVQVLSGIPDVRGIRPLPDGRMLVWTYRNVIHIYNGERLLETPFLSVPPVHDQTERAIFGVEIDPAFAENGHVYVYYRWHENLQNRLSRFTVSAGNPNVVDPATERVLLDNMTERGVFHNGGGLIFGSDSYLYVAIGDTGRGVYAQDLSTLMGSVLRLSPTSYPNVIPLDNPFAGVSGARGEIWAYGFRNPFSASIDPQTGRIFINDVGEDSWEEINVLRRGRNFGWSILEGPSPDSSYESPWQSYPHIEGGDCALTGGTFYAADAFPGAFHSNYFFLDYCARWLKRITPDGSVVTFAPAGEKQVIRGNPISLQVGADGQLYYASQADGAVYSIRYQSNVPPVPVLQATPSSGQAPLTVSLDASASTDANGDPLSYFWEFGDGSAPATRAQLSHMYKQEGVYTLSLRVDDGRGGSTQAVTQIVVGTPPTATINLPTSDKTYRAGERITFRGSASDLADGALPANAYSWQIIFHHDDHTHPNSILNAAQEGNFTTDDKAEPSVNTWYRIHLTVTNSRGLSSNVFRDIYPRVSSLTLKTEPPGLTVSLDGTPTMTPVSKNGIVNFNFTLGASTQTVNGKTYRFVRWSDGGAQTHDIRVSATPATYTAHFECSSCESEQLVNTSTLEQHSANFSTDHPVENLWDSCLKVYLDNKPVCTAGAGSIESFWLAFDFGQVYELSQGRLFGDTGGNWHSSTWSLDYRADPDDPWQPAFSKRNAFVDSWVTEPLSIKARYVRVTVYGNVDRPGTQARELEIYGTPVGGSLPSNLVNDTTYLSDSANFEQQHPVANLWDGCLRVYLDNKPVCTTGAGDIGSFWVNFDFGQDHQLSRARLYGDAGSNWHSSAWRLEYRVDPNDAWQTAFSNKNAFVDDWVSEPLSVTARYVRVTVYGNTTRPGTQARELEIYGIPGP